MLSSLVAAGVVLPVPVRDASLHDGADSLAHHAVSRFVVQIGTRTAMTSAVVIASKVLRPRCGMAQLLRLERQMAADRAPSLQVGSCVAITFSAASSDVGAPPAARVTPMSDGPAMNVVESIEARWA